MLEIIKKHRTDIILTVLGLFISFSAPVDPDFGWHYKYGEHIIQNKEMPRENLFSYTFPEYKWANSYWISEIIFYLAYSNLGIIGAGLVFSGFAILTTTAILKKAIKEKTNETTKNLTKILTTILILIVYDQFKVICRPLLFSSIFLLLLSYSIIYKPKNLKYSPVLFLLWANMHADFTLGLGVLGLYNIQLLLTKGINKKTIPTYLSSLASVGVTLINPYGLGLWETLLSETNNFQFWHIQEWLPLTNKDFLLVYCGASALIAISLIELKDKKKNMWLITSLGIFFLASLRSCYFIRVFIILGIIPMCNFIVDVFEISKGVLDEKNSNKVKKASRLVFWFVFLTAGIAFVENVLMVRDHEFWAEKAGYPYEAVQFIKENPEEFSGKMFNNYAWGGYLIWQLPEHKTFVDGRMPSWRIKDSEGKEYSVFEDYTKITREPGENFGLLEKYEIKWVLVKKDLVLARFLEGDKSWETIFENEKTIIFQREKGSPQDI